MSPFPARPYFDFSPPGLKAPTCANLSRKMSRRPEKKMGTEINSSLSSEQERELLCCPFLQSICRHEGKFPDGTSLCFLPDQVSAFRRLTPTGLAEFLLITGHSNSNYAVPAISEDYFAYYESSIMRVYSVKMVAIVAPTNSSDANESETDVGDCDDPDLDAANAPVQSTMDDAEVDVELSAYHNPDPVNMFATLSNAGEFCERLDYFSNKIFHTVESMVVTEEDKSNAVLLIAVFRRYTALNPLYGLAQSVMIVCLSVGRAMSDDKAGIFEAFCDGKTVGDNPKRHNTYNPRLLNKLQVCCVSDDVFNKEQASILRGLDAEDTESMALFNARETLKGAFDLYVAQALGASTDPVCKSRAQVYIQAIAFHLTRCFILQNWEDKHVGSPSAAAGCSTDQLDCVPDAMTNTMKRRERHNNGLPNPSTKAAKYNGKNRLKGVGL